MADALWSDVKLLWHCDGPNDSIVHKDASYNTLLSGSPPNKTATKKFGASSVYYNGTTATTVHNETILRTEYLDFTIECWINLEALPVAGTGTTSYSPIISTRSNDDNRVLLSVVNLTGVTTGTGLYFLSSDVGLSTSLAADFAFATGQWYHIAVCKYGTDWRLFIDGNVVASTTSSYRNPPITADILIGKYVGFAGTSYFKGYMDEWRITHAARYTGAFTPATDAFGTGTLPQAADNLPIYRDNEVFNLPFSKKAANSTYIYHTCPRAAMTPNGWNTNAPVIVDTSPKYKNGSLELNGSEGRSVVFKSTGMRVNSALLNTAKYTIEFWLYPTAAGAYHNYVFKLGSAQYATHGNADLTLTLQGGGLWYAQIDGGFQEQNTVSNTKLLTYITQRWYHVVVEAAGSDKNIYVDGVLRNTVYNSYAPNLTSMYMAFGGAYSYYYYNYSHSYSHASCRISDFRMVMSVNRYGGKYMPPTKALPESLNVDPHWGNVVLLLPMQARANPAATTDANVAMDIKGHGMSATSGLGTVNYTPSATVGIDRYAGANKIELAAGQQISGTHADFNLGTADWTIEFLYYAGTAGQTKPMVTFKKPNGTDWLCGVYEVASTVVFKVGGSVSLSAGTVSGGTGGFAHHSFSKIGGTVYSHKNGVFVASANSTDLLDMTTNNAIAFFYDASAGAPITGSLGLAAAMQMFRMTIGVGRYTDVNYESIAHEMFPHESAEVISGIVRDSNGVPASRKVRCYHRENGNLIDEKLSDPTTGEYVFQAQRAGQHYIMCLDDTANALVYDHITPVIIP